jgi:hypothetical protein
VPSVDAALAEEAETVKAVFLERMGTSAVTYRVEGRVSIMPRDGDREVAFVETRYDVAGDDYAGFVRMRGDEITSNGDYYATILDGTGHVMLLTGFDLIRTDVPPSLRTANPYRFLDAADLVFQGMSDDGLFSYTVVPWILGEPVGEWVDLGVAQAPTLVGASVESHDTRLTIDSDGIPHQLTSSWTFATPRGGPRWRASLVDDYAWFGLWVSITEPHADGFWEATSHNLLGAVDANNEPILTPWMPVVPDGATATLDVTFLEAEEPMMLGIEGAIPFVAAIAPDGTVLAEQKLDFEGALLPMPAGEYAIVVSYRACDGSCALLDPPHRWCVSPAQVAAGEMYSLAVQAVTRDRAVCTLGPAG